VIGLVPAWSTPLNVVRVLVATDASSDSGFSQLLNQHLVQPAAGVVQVAILALAMFAAMASVGSHHQEHWTTALLRPVGLGVAGIGIVQVLKLAANGVLSGNLGF
jgi:hypothetical protein